MFCTKYIAMRYVICLFLLFRLLRIVRLVSVCVIQDDVLSEMSLCVVWFSLFNVVTFDRVCVVKGDLAILLSGILQLR